MKVLELDYSQLPLIVKIRGKAQTKTYMLKSSARKLAACLVSIEDGLLQLIPDAK